MCTLLCRDNNYEPPAEMWVKLVPSNGWEDMVADYSYVTAESGCKHKSENCDGLSEFERALRILSDEELIWDYLCDKLTRLA